MNTNDIKNVVIVGDGTAGWVTGRNSMKKILVLATIFTLSSCDMIQGDRVVFSSPDGRTSITLTAGEGQTRYSVTRDGKAIVAPSDLGFAFKNMAPLGGNMAVVSSETSASDTTWEQPWGERQYVRDNHKELFIELQENNETKRKLNVRFRLFDDGLGFRYEFPEQDGITSTVITDELTGFAFDADASAWWIPTDMTKNRYEVIYKNTPLSEVPKAHTPITLKTKGGTYLSLHEAALVDYSGMSLQQSEDGHFEADLSPWANGDKVRTGSSFKTPWRTIQIADSAIGLQQSDLILNLNEPNKLGDVSWVEPSKYVGIWWEMHLGVSSWGSGEKHGATTENTKRYIDFAAKYGFKGVLVEGWNVGWDGDWVANGDLFSFTEAYPDYDIEALAAYAKERGVRLVGHNETSGGIENYEAQMDAAFAMYEKLGIAQVKTGYVADIRKIKGVNAAGERVMEFHDGQYMAAHHIKVLKAAAKHKVSINSHEPIKDTGLRRTYPNWIAREGARGQEYNAWGTPGNPPSHTAIIPFTRMLSGPMDFTPGTFDLLFEGMQGDNRVSTTLAKQLALYVVLYSPIQMASDLPENYEKHLDAFQFIRDVPTDWSESLALDGEIGDFVITARKDRASEDWFMGGLTADNAREVVQSLSFLTEGVTYEAQIYRDGEGGNWDTNPYAFATEKKTVTKDDSLSLTMVSGGGFAVRFKALP